tara:strand:- start:1518 stop:2015 length:498 start_codon:yes stop_codon:yes gene_type:complete
MTNPIINNIDLLYLTNKGLYNKYLSQEDIEYNKKIINDVKKYKKIILSKTKELVELYTDTSNNSNMVISHDKNEAVKYKNYFYCYLDSLIEHIKHDEFKKTIQNDLSNCNNISKKKKTVVDISNNLINMNNDLINNRPKKINTLNSFVKRKNTGNEVKILPKKRD